MTTTERNQLNDQDTAIISDAFRVPITAQRKNDGGVILRGPRTMLLLSPTEVDRFIDFADDTPRLGKIQRYPIRTR